MSHMCIVISLFLLSLSAAHSLQAAAKAIFRDVNILLVTDTHSWLAAHVHPDQMPIADATIGNITSFVAAMKDQAKVEGKDVFFFDNGDVVDGTGLSNASPVNGEALFPLLMNIPFDAMSIGNHELYDESTFKAMISSGYIACRNGSYLSSNVYFADTLQPIASRYVVLEGPNSGVRLLVFGVLYDMTDNTDYVTVETVESMVKSEWFKLALTEEVYDSVVLLAHMHYADPLINVLLQAIRSLTSEQTPIQFLTGHSHIRAYSNPDAFSSNLEAGNYYNTIGYASYDLSSREESVESIDFFHDFYEPNTDTLAQILDKSQAEMITAQGISLDSDVFETRDRMGLLADIGYLNSHYSINVSPYTDESLYNLYLNEVAPSTLFSPPHNSSQILATGTGLLRYDLFAGKVLADDIWTICPFSEPYYIIQSVSGEDLIEAFALLNTDKYKSFQLMSRRGLQLSQSYALPNYLLSSYPMAGSAYDVLASEWDASYIVQALKEVCETAPNEPYQYGNFTTTDLWLQWMSNRADGIH